MDTSPRRSSRVPHRLFRLLAGAVMTVVVGAGVLVPGGAVLASTDFVMPVNGVVGDRVYGCPAGSRPTHQGVDINMNANAVVYAAAAGTVTTAVNSAATSGYGTQVIITHPDGHTTRYAHMVYMSVTLKVGAAVAQGAPLGLVGSTGASSGAHLHFEILRGTTNITNSYFSCAQGTVNALSPLTPRRVPLNADINGDGNPDLLAISTTGQLYSYASNGRGGWLSSTVLATEWGGVHTIVRGDFDGDGQGDIMAVRDDGTLWFHRNLGNGSFQATQVGNGWGSMRLISGGADFTDDRRADIVAITGDGRLFLYKGNGVGGFAETAQIGQGWSGMSVILVGDYTGDNRGDILARDGEGRLLLYPGNGVGVVGGPQIGNGWNSMTAIAGGTDYNSDSHADILARDQAGDLWLYPWLGSTVFGSRIKVGNGWNMHRLIQ